MFLIFRQTITKNQDVINIYSTEYIQVQVQNIINIVLKYT